MSSRATSALTISPCCVTRATHIRNQPYWITILQANAVVPSTGLVCVCNGYTYMSVSLSLRASLYLSVFLSKLATRQLCQWLCPKPGKRKVRQSLPALTLPRATCWQIESADKGKLPTSQVSSRGRRCSVRFWFACRDVLTMRGRATAGRRRAGGPSYSG